MSLYDPMKVLKAKAEFNRFRFARVCCTAIEHRGNVFINMPTASRDIVDCSIPMVPPAFCTLRRRLCGITCYHCNTCKQECTV